jgi:hypothetical protein
MLLYDVVVELMYTCTFIFGFMLPVNIEPTYLSKAFNV